MTKPLLVVIGMILFIPTFVLGSQEQCKRVPLKKATEIHDAKEGEVEVENDKNSGNVIISWKDYDGRPIMATFVPATKIEMTVESTIEENLDKKCYVFNYVLHNSDKSEQSIEAFTLETETGVTITGFDSPEGWRNTVVRVRPAVDWFSSSKSVSPGTSSSRFRFETSDSDLVPGLIKCYGRGNSGSFKVPAEPPSEVLRRLLPRGIFENAVYGWTLGPVKLNGKGSEAISAHLKSTFLMTKNLGWMSDLDFHSNLNSRLDEVTKLISDSKSDAIPTIKGVIMQTEQAFNDKTICREVRDLVVLNLKLILALQEETKKR